MKRLVETIVAVFVLIVFVSSAEAIDITTSEITGGAVVVQGNHARKSKDITWEGRVVAKSNKGGAFKFATTDLPLDCVGELSDGVDTIDVVVDGCTTQQVGGGGILKTGQTKCYDSAGNVIACAGTGQDGELQKGVARSYTDNLDGTITDNVTGLMWEHLALPFTWAEAFQRIALLNGGIGGPLAGHNDWRLPNINELQTLVDSGRFDPAHDPVFNLIIIGGFQPNYYWSSTTLAGALFDPDDAWVVTFAGGSVYVGNKNEPAVVRGVRGGS